MTTYNVYRDGKKIKSELTDTNYTDTGLTPNTSYKYQVSAENDAGESELSAAKTVKTDYSPVESVAVSPKTNNLEVGGTRTLSATVSPDTAKQQVTWSTSDEGIATVGSDGKVTAVGAGTATITASAGGKQGNATVSVTEPEAPPEGES